MLILEPKRKNLLLLVKPDNCNNSQVTANQSGVLIGNGVIKLFRGGVVRSFSCQLTTKK